MSRNRTFWSVVLASLLFASTGYGTITLVDGNAVALFDPASPAGQQLWTVDGINQLQQQWFWYRIGNTPEQSLDTISFPAIGPVTPSTMTLNYANPQLSVTTFYSLFGGAVGSGTSDLAEQIRIYNLGASPLDFHFFQYVNFDLAGTPAGDTVEFVNNNTARQWKGATILSETVDTVLGAMTTHREVGYYNATLLKLNDGLPTTLNDNMGPLGPGNVTWAFQWDFVIAPYGSVLISKDKVLVVPEPACAVLLALGTLLLRRRH